MPNLALNTSKAGIQVLDLTHRAASVATSFYRGLATFVTNMQIGRMKSVLRSMTDEQLTEIGITRQQIPAHAEHLITYRYDGL